MSSESDDSRSLLASVFGDLFVDSEPPDPIRENLRVEQVVPTPPEARYELRDLLGRGGVGEVRRALDHALHRKVAIKTLREDLADRPGQVQRFLREARIVANLQHPAIVPIHELGLDTGGRWYIAMQEVSGRDFANVIRRFHEARADRPRHGQYAGLTLRRLVEHLRVAAEAIAFVHTRSVVHRDLKPENIMVGDYGEIYVVDWGLARDLRVPRDLEGLDSAESWNQRSALQTADGALIGTPAYMAPEQARGDRDAVGVRTDVWALGGILYAVLMGRPPYGGTAREALAAVLQGPPELPDLPDVAPELLDICRRAMQWDPEDRYADGAAFVADVVAFLDGAKARERALVLVGEAESALPELQRCRRDAHTKELRARVALRALRPTEALDAKEAAWSLEEEALTARHVAEELSLRIAAKARAAMAHVPDLPQARALLADLYRQRVEAAEAEGDQLLARESLALLAEHDDGQHSEFLRAQGTVSLAADSPGAEVQLYRYALRRRRQQLLGVGRPIPMPVTALSLPMGSYIAVLKAPGRETMRYPFALGRGEVWDGVPPGGAETAPLPMACAGDLRPGDRYVPMGWAWCGGDADAVGSLARQRLWIDGFVIRDRPVTNGEYLGFLNALVARGQAEAALRVVPRLCEAGDEGPPLFLWSGKQWTLPEQAGGLRLRLDSPVVYVSWYDANAYVHWVRAVTGQPWRLPGELEREKAARGADARPFPWGDQADPAFACMEDSRLDQPGAPPTEDFPVDESPTFVHGLSGGVRDWCADRFHPMGPARRGSRAVPPSVEPPDEARYGGPQRAVRGGAWNLPSRAGRAASRTGLEPDSRRDNLGLRLCRSYPT